MPTPDFNKLKQHVDDQIVIVTALLANLQQAKALLVSDANAENLLESLKNSGALASFILTGV